MTTTVATTVRAATNADQERVAAAITLAFSGDPVARWIFPTPHEYLDQSPALMKAFAGRAFEHGTAFYADGFAGAALWLPPGVGPDEESMAAVLEHAVPAERLEMFFTVMEQMGTYHPPELHWYLPLIGVEPAWQRKGLGSALLEYSLALIDRDGMPAYLESSNPANIPLYERHGFKIIGQIQAGDFPTLHPMLRQPYGGG